jgi:prepilin-type N-terminal cleavage/methylation domain-containing protein|tara:strand:+ start:804 stop:1391 length:588 start_codon:yes stop_codon:yes gene_type:complete
VISSRRHQKGYTLIEIMVVIAVIALIAAVAATSINQTLNRRYSSEAEKLSIWLNQLADFAIMQGAAFGVLSKTDKKTKKTTQLSAVMYYRNQWVEVSFPEPYEFGEGASIAWLADDSDKKPLVYQQAALPTREEIEEGLEVKDEDDFLQPSMAFLPDGYIEPEGVIELNYESNEISYSYNWDSEELRIKMEKNKK